MTTEHRLPAQQRAGSARGSRVGDAGSGSATGLVMRAAGSRRRLLAGSPAVAPVSLRALITTATMITAPAMRHLPERRDADERQRVLDHAEKQRAEDGAGDAADAAGEQMPPITQAAITCNSKPSAIST